MDEIKERWSHIPSNLCGNYFDAAFRHEELHGIHDQYCSLEHPEQYDGGVYAMAKKDIDALCGIVEEKDRQIKQLANGGKQHPVETKECRVCTNHDNLVVPTDMIFSDDNVICPSCRTFFHIFEKHCHSCNEQRDHANINGFVYCLNCGRVKR